MLTSRSARRRRPTSRDADPNTVIIGRVLKPHGLRGELRVEPLTDHPQRYRRLREVSIREQEYRVLASRVHQGQVLLKLETVETVKAAEDLRGEYLRVPLESVAELPEGSYYHFQLIGLQVETTAGEPLGRVTDVLPREANDVYVVSGERGEVLVPGISDVVKSIDVDGGRMLVESVPGLLPWEPE
ncbi:MAG: ribosome maturation factor RimM [Chloroflexota bacterium]|nr:ribosome maturation factor RimM [Chloroflexota bacterium]